MLRFRRWAGVCHLGPFPVQHRLEHRKLDRSTRSEVAQLAGRNLDGNQIAWKLVMDEPTNDLDIETLELLESLLVDYQGTVLLVSHDRAFLNDVVTSTLVIQDDGLVKEYEGGYDDYLRQRPAEPASQSRPNPDVPRKKAADAPVNSPAS